MANAFSKNIWQTQMAVTSGKNIWQKQMAEANGGSIWHNPPFPYPPLKQKTVIIRTVI